jgi:diguanylate cyclase (GGDEF)-like protein
MPEAEEKRRGSFCDYYRDAVSRLLALGYTSSQIEILRSEFGLLASDNVTGFHEGRSGPGRVITLGKAIQHVKETGERAFYIVMDLSNLSGLNARLTHTGANEVFREIAAIIRAELSKAASESSFFRHGGDEMSAFLINTGPGAVLAGITAVQSGVHKLAQDRQLNDTPHAKHPDNQRLRGIGVHFGICEIIAQHESVTTQVFKEADSRLEEQKNSLALRESNDSRLRDNTSSQVAEREIHRLLAICARDGVAAILQEVIDCPLLLSALARACDDADLASAANYLSYLEFPYD